MIAVSMMINKPFYKTKNSFCYFKVQYLESVQKLVTVVVCKSSTKIQRLVPFLTDQTEKLSHKKVINYFKTLFNHYKF